MRQIKTLKLILGTLILLSLVNILYAQFQRSSSIGVSELIYVLGVLLILIVVMLILREFACWYWKINEIVSLLKDIKGTLGSSSTCPKAKIEEQHDIQEDTKKEEIKITEEQRIREKEKAEKDWQESKKKRDDTFLKF
jgi:hypothetical protein